MGTAFRLCGPWGNSDETSRAGSCVARTCLFLVRPVKAASPDVGPGRTSPHYLHEEPRGTAILRSGTWLVFAFNHEESARAFRRASKLDPQSAMAFWGIALALGPCINLDVDPPHEKAAYEAAQKALSLAPGATESERDYIQTLAK